MHLGEAFLMMDLPRRHATPFNGPKPARTPLNAPASVPIRVYPEGLAFFPGPPFLEGHGAFVCDQDLALTVRIRDPRFQVASEL